MLAACWSILWLHQETLLKVIYELWCSAEALTHHQNLQSLIPFLCGITFPHPRNFLKLFYCCSITVVCIYPPPFPIPTAAIPTSLVSMPPWFCPCVLYSCSRKPFSPSSLPLSPLVTVSLFSISVSLVIFCLLVCFIDQGPLKGKIIWYLSLITRLISLSIMLASSTMLSQRVGAPSFFLLHSNSLCKCTTVF